MKESKLTKTWAPGSTIPDSSDGNESSGDEIVVGSSEDRRKTRSLKEVSIPVMASGSTMKRPTRASTATSPADTTLSSLGSTPRATSLEYETPGTTPATSITGTTNGKRKRSLLGKNVIRVVDSEDDEDSDAALARKLQEEEFMREDTPNKRAKTGSSKRGFVVDDSDDEESELSEPESLESEDLMPVRKPGGPTKGKQSVAGPTTVATRKKTNLPSRNSRSKLSIQQDAMDIDDSEPASENLSEPDSGDEFAEESEAASTGVSDAESEAASTSTGNASAAPTGASARRGGARGSSFW